MVYPETLLFSGVPQTNQSVAFIALLPHNKETVLLESPQ